MTTSWELIMAAHTSWHSREAASGDHWCKSRAETKLVWSLPRRNSMTGVAKNKARRRTAPAVSSPYLEKIEPPPAVSIQQKSPGR